LLVARMQITSDNCHVRLLSRASLVWTNQVYPVLKEPTTLWNQGAFCTRTFKAARESSPVPAQFVPTVPLTSSSSAYPVVRFRET
jgi:hypothetical protein